ncbi:transmembrane protein 272-like [Thunnus albacares]|uniref:transmembrane protein 272-like n=1 Tax=Thunnus albacares TaxID=8236 RepID=UPI001CF653A5|nr:transmembrane protein 272-like [Thunnus albacares]
MFSLSELIMPESDRPVVIVCVLVLFILVIGQTVVGAVYRNECPRQPFIPVYLLGFVSFSIILLCWCNMCKVDCSCMIVPFLFCWFIAGSIAIYSIYEPNYKKRRADSYCNKTLYLFAFWSTNLIYVLLGVIICSFCCCKPQNQDDTQTRAVFTISGQIPSQVSSIQGEMQV